MREIKCNECGKVLFTTERESNGAAGAEAQNLGFIYKNACLFSDKYSSLFFCNHEHSKAFYQKNIPSNPQMTKVLNEIKKDIPQMAKEVSQKMADLCEKLNIKGNTP